MSAAMGLPATDKILIEKDGPVGRLIFNNPARHNAVSFEMWEAAAAALADFAADPEIRVIVLSGAGGKAFVSGADISKFENERAEMDQIQRYNAMTASFYTALGDFPKPTIAAIRGYCIGGGLGVAVVCDIRLCTEGSRFALPAAKLGLGYGYPAIKRLSEAVGLSFTKEIFFTARQFSSQEAVAMGLVNRVLPDDELDAYVDSYTAMIGANAPMTMATAKYAVTQLGRESGERDTEGCAARVRACFESDDYKEGRRAFMEKRKPRFQGR